MDIFILPAEEAFIHIGSVIGFFILLSVYLNYKTNGNFAYIIFKNKRSQPLIGAIIGAIPGCGGSLAIIPLYIQNKLSFGTIVASLISSMGDAAFILISTNLKLYIFVTIIGIVTGIITGYIVDLFNLEIRLNLKTPNHNMFSRSYSNLNKFDNIDNIKNSNFVENINKPRYEMPNNIVCELYITIILIGFVLMIISHSGINSIISEKIHFLEEIIAVFGIILSIIYMIYFKTVFKNYNEIKSENDKISLKEIFTHSVGEISFVITFIYISYIIYDLSIIAIGGEEILTQFILYTGIGSVLIGSALGLIPGCGIQILLMSFYLRGNIPLGVLIANSISQDGDALFPLIAMDKKSAFWATIFTTIPAIIVGVVIYIFIK